ncbi:MAG: hypothetical protein ACXWC7_06015, partial [Chitinophagaceae bacterium]
MTKNKLSTIEIAILAVAIIVLAAGFILFYADKLLFDQYVQEDGIAEWLTVVGLLSGSIACFYRFKK